VLRADLPAIDPAGAVASIVFALLLGAAARRPAC
jgi:hypothetical protein